MQQWWVLFLCLNWPNECHRISTSYKNPLFTTDKPSCVIRYELGHLSPNSQDWQINLLHVNAMCHSSNKHRNWNFTLTLRSSAVVSSNSTPSLKLISVDLKVLTVLSVMTSPSMEIMVVGLVILPTWRVANPTPETNKYSQKIHKGWQVNVHLISTTNLMWIHNCKHFFVKKSSWEKEYEHSLKAV